MQYVLHKNILLTDLLAYQHLFEIILTSFTFENSENVVRSECFEKRLQWGAQFFLLMNEGYKFS